MSAPDPGLGQVDESDEGPDLAAVGVPGEDEPDVVRGGLEGGLRLVGEEHDLAAGVAAVEGLGEIRTVAGRHPRRLVVVHAGEIERIDAAADGDAFVPKHADAVTHHLRDPAIDAAVVLVVPGDEVDAVGRPEVGEGRRLVSELVDGAVHEVAGDGDEVGSEVVDAADHVREPLVSVGDAEVEG